MSLAVVIQLHRTVQFTHDKVMAQGSTPVLSSLDASHQVSLVYRHVNFGLGRIMPGFGVDSHINVVVMARKSQCNVRMWRRGVDQRDGDVGLLPPARQDVTV